MSMLVLVLCCLWCVHPGRPAGNMQVVLQWKQVNYQFRGWFSEIWMKLVGSYIPGNPFPLDVDTSPLDPHGRVFVTLPRFLPGVPATLATVDNVTSELVPYPDWSWHQEGDCGGITSVLRTKTDRCGRLWVADCGVVDVLTPNIRRICQPKVLVFDLRTDSLLWRYVLPQGVLTPVTLLSTVEVDVDAHDCQRTLGYLADVQGNGLIVVDLLRRTSWRARSNLFYPYPTAGHLDIDGQQFDLMDGVISLALTPPAAGNNRTLYFHSLASVRESSVSTAVLRDQSRRSSYKAFKLLAGRRSGQAGPSAMDGTGSALFFSVLPDNSLNCWNPATPYSQQNIAQVFRDDVAFQFASGLKVVRDRSGQDWVWALTSRYQRVATGSLDPSDVNFRVLRGPVKDLVKGTLCA